MAAASPQPRRGESAPGGCRPGWVTLASKPTQFRFLLPLVPAGMGRGDLCPNVISFPRLLLSK